MRIEFDDNGGIVINLTGDEVATAIDSFLESHNIKVTGARTITVNGSLCKYGRVYIDPSGSAVVLGINELKFCGNGELEWEV